MRGNGWTRRREVGDPLRPGDDGAPIIASARGMRGSGNRKRTRVGAGMADFRNGIGRGRCETAMRVGYSGICRDAELANQLDHAGPTVMGVGLDDARGSGGGGGYAFLAKKAKGVV